MKKLNAISTEDVYKVANFLAIIITEEEVNYVLSQYAAEQTSDPTASWDLVVENIIYNLKT